MTFTLKPNAAQRESLMRIADGLVVGIALALPWSTSATVILICLWVVTVLPTIEPDTLKQEMSRPAAFLPVALFVFATIGMLWSPVPLKERLGGIDSFLKLLTIPLLMIQFRRSDRGTWAMAAFLGSGTLLLVASVVALLSAKGDGWGLAKGYGLPVKDYIAQSAIFTVCAFGLFYLAIDAFRLRWRIFGTVFLLLGLLFLADLFFVTTSRTALLTLPFLLLLLGSRQFGLKGTAATFALGVILAAAVWAASPVVRERLGSLVVEITQPRSDTIGTPAGERINFWKRSIDAIAEAPVFGHGTGAIRDVFKRSASGQGTSAVVSVNPHNQTLAVAIQLGMFGALLLFAMWISHFALFFRGAGMASWIGLLLVAQNVIGSLANSHLFDFTHGWMYCIGVGICGGMATRQGAPLSIFAPSCKAATAKS
jgi:O-antigen ligase